MLAIWRSFGALISKCSLADLKMKLTKICDSETLVQDIWGTFELVAFNMICGLFSALATKMVFNSKTVRLKVKWHNTFHYILHGETYVFFHIYVRLSPI